MKRNAKSKSAKKATTAGVILPVDEAVAAIAELYKEGKEVNAIPLANGKYKVTVVGEENRQGTTLRGLPDTTGTSDDGPSGSEVGSGDQMQKDPRDIDNEFPEMESNAGMILTKSQARDALTVLRDHKIKANAEKIGKNQYMVIIAEESMEKLSEAQGLDYEVLDASGGDSEDDPHGNSDLHSSPGSMPEASPDDDDEKDDDEKDDDEKESEANWDADHKPHVGGDDERADDDPQFDKAESMGDDMLDMDDDGMPDQDMEMDFEAMDDDDMLDMDNDGLDDLTEDPEIGMYASSGWIDEDTAYRAVKALAKHNVTAFVEEEDGKFRVTTAEDDSADDDEEKDYSDDDKDDDKEDSLEEGTVDMIDHSISAGDDDDDKPPWLKKGKDDDDDKKDDDDDDAESSLDGEGVLSVSGVNYELLAAPEELEGVSSAEVEMTLHASESDNPRWHVAVRGMPVAFIDLKSQERPDETYSYFVNDEYGRHLTSAFDTMDARELLNQVNATWYANKVNNAKLVAALKAKVEAKLERKHQKAMAALSDNLLGNIRLAIAGANKNFFPEFDHQLKAALFKHLDDAGVYSPYKVIEAAFDEGEGPYFEAIITKAQELMAKPLEVRKELASVIGESGVLSVIEADVDEEDEMISLGQHLEDNNVPIVAGTSREPLNAKEAVRAKLALGGSGPHRS